MSRKTRAKRSNKPRDRPTQTDLKLYTVYNTRAAAEADIERLETKAKLMIGETSSPLVSGLRHQRHADISIQPASPEILAQAKPGTDYQSIIISKKSNRGESNFYYAQDKGGELQRTGTKGLQEADDPGDMPDTARPFDAPEESTPEFPPAPPDPDYVPNLPEPSPAQFDYQPLKGEDGKRDSARRFINTETGEIISRRAHMKLTGIIPEVKKADRKPPKQAGAGGGGGTIGGYVVIVSYGATTND